MAEQNQREFEEKESQRLVAEAKQKAIDDERIAQENQLKQQEAETERLAQEEKLN